MARKKTRLPSLQLNRSTRLLILLTLVAMVGLGSYMFLTTDSPQPPQTQQAPAPIQSIPAQVSETEESATVQNDDLIQDQIQEINSTSETQTDDTAPAEALATDIVPPVDDSEPLLVSDYMPTDTATTVTEPVIAPLSPQPVDITPALIEATVTAEPVQESRPTSTPPPATQPQVTAPASVALAPALQQLEAMGLKNPAWLKQQSPQNWTLQVLGARDPETLIKFARQHKLGDDSAWFVTDLNGKPWYVLVHRFYANRDIARNAISRLPAGLRQARPWVKSLQAIHKSMR